jgi:hypothetical protein
MSQYLLLNNVVVPHVVKRTIDEALELAEQTIERLQSRMRMLAVCTPYATTDDYGEATNWVDYVEYEVNTALEELQETYIARHLLTIAKTSDENDVKESY